MDDELRTTVLTPEEEARFRKWYESTAATLNLDPDPDGKEHYYDYRGYWKEYGDKTMQQGDHFTDTYKLPGHATFSNESKYYPYAPEKAGHWEGDTFVPPAAEANANAQGVTQPAAVTDDLSKARADLDKANQELVEQTAQNNAQMNKTFADMINDYYAEKKAEEERMRMEEKTDQLAAMSTGMTELAANLINMFSVGGLHATNQQYHSYSQDWMRKADENIRENRRRREGMADTLRRLKLQQEQVRQSGSINEMKLKVQLAQDRYRDAYNEKKDSERRDEQEWERGMKERQLDLQERNAERQNKATDASIAQGWARIGQQQKEMELKMIMGGWVPDKNAPGGYRYDPQKAAELSGQDVNTIASSSSSSGGRTNTNDYPIIDAQGNVNVAHLKSDEMKSVLINARETIRQDLGEDEAKEFDKEFRRAADDNAKNAVLMKWIGKSEKMEELIRSVDAEYAGNHRRPNSVERTQERPTNQSGYYNPDNSKTGLGNFK